MYELHQNRPATLGNLPPYMAAAVAYLARYHGGTFLLYERYLHQYLSWRESAGIDPLSATRGHVELYVRSLMECGIKNSTVNTSMTAVKGYYKMAHMDGVIDRDPAIYALMPKISKPRRRQYVDRSDIRKFLLAAKLISPRHWAATQLMGVMGLRVSEVASLTLEDAQHVSNGIRVVEYIGKGGKNATTPIPYQSISDINAVIDNRTTGWLITRRDGGRLSRSGMTGLIETVNRHAKLDVHINPHYLRALAVTQGKEAGLSMDELREFARHEDERTTRRHYILGDTETANHPVHVIGARLAI